jgi:hypothetical protein
VFEREKGRGQVVAVAIQTKLATVSMGLVDGDESAPDDPGGRCLYPFPSSDDPVRGSVRKQAERTSQFGIPRPVYLVFLSRPSESLHLKHAVLRAESGGAAGWPGVILSRDRMVHLPHVTRRAPRR